MMGKIPPTIPTISVNMTWTLDRTLNSKGFWANLGGFNYDGSDWQSGSKHSGI